MLRPGIMRNLFLGAALLLSHLMCAVVAYAYCTLEWGGRYAGYSAAPSAALVYLIPYGLGVWVWLGTVTEASPPAGWAGVPASVTAVWSR